jgi:single-strand DNA-binding protein
MSGTINKVILIGNLGKDPEVRHLENGGIVANFSVATSDVFVDRTTGEKKSLTDWHDIVAWKHLAELAEKYLHKGTKVYVEGKLKKRTWQDKEGNTRYSIDVIAEELTILSRTEHSEKNFTKPNHTSEGTPNAPSPMSDLSSDSLDGIPF